MVRRRARNALRWADLDAFEEVGYDLFVVYWDRQRQLLYINSSDTGWFGRRSPPEGKIWAAAIS